MHKILRAHTFHDTEQIYVRNVLVMLRYDGAIQAWIANLIPRRGALYFSTIKPWGLKNLLNAF